MAEVRRGGIFDLAIVLIDMYIYMYKLTEKKWELYKKL